MGKDLLLQDALLNTTVTLPNGAGNATSPSIDLGNGPNGQFAAFVEFQIQAPALSNTQAPANSLVTYNIMQSVDNVTFTQLYGGVLIQTGSGAGSAANTATVRVPLSVARYIALQVVNGGSGAANASGATASMAATF